MRKDKDQAFELRKKGHSYREIESLLGVSRSTLSEWFRDVEWSRHVRKTNDRRSIAVSREHIGKMNTARKERLDKLYREISDQAAIDFHIYKSEPLFMAGLMIYAGEGDKVTRNLTRISNSEFYLHKIFIRFTLKYMGIKREDLRCALILYPEHDIESCTAKWAEELELAKSQFHKPQVIVGKESKRRLQFGVGMSILSSTTLKKRVLTWLEACAKNAGLV